MTKLKEAVKKYARPLLLCAFLLYLLALVTVLFIVPRNAKFSSFELYLRYSTNFVPFKTIFGYIEKVLRNPSWLKVASLNILGNIALFLPMGAFLPCLFKHFDRLWKTLAVIAVMVIIAECTQMLLLIGIFDIDDFILNLPGAAIGYGLVKLQPINEFLRELGFLKQ